MALAITALEVAFVSAIAALVSAVVAPLSSWLVSHAARGHERRLAQDERIFGSRSEAYQDIVRDARRDLRGLRAFLDAIEGPGADVPGTEFLGTAETWADLEGRAFVFSSEGVIEKYLVFRAMMSQFMQMGLKEITAVAGGDPAEQEARLQRLAQKQRAFLDLAEAQLDELAKAMRLDLR